MARAHAREVCAAGRRKGPRGIHSRGERKLLAEQKSHEAERERAANSPRAKLEAEFDRLAATDDDPIDAPEPSEPTQGGSLRSVLESEYDRLGGDSESPAGGEGANQ
jgi:hypothetical protein